MLSVSQFYLLRPCWNRLSTCTIFLSFLPIKLSQLSPILFLRVALSPEFGLVNDLRGRAMSELTIGPFFSPCNGEPICPDAATRGVANSKSTLRVATSGQIGSPCAR